MLSARDEIIVTFIKKIDKVLIMITQYSCLSKEGKLTSCSECEDKNYCTAYALICDLTATRVVCPNCKRPTKEEHVRYCPFCGFHVLDIPMSDKQVKPIGK